MRKNTQHLINNNNSITTKRIRRHGYLLRMKEDIIPNKVLNMKQELRFLQLCCQDSSLLGCYAMQTGKYKSCAKSMAMQFFY